MQRGGWSRPQPSAACDPEMEEARIADAISIISTHLSVDGSHRPRLAVVALLYPEHLNPDCNFWRFAGKAGYVAQSLVEGRGYGSPLFGIMGPTAWMPPQYPLLVAGGFELFGVYTNASAIATCGQFDRAEGGWAFARMEGSKWKFRINPHNVNSPPELFRPWRATKDCGRERSVLTAFLPPARSVWL